jgi:hypothetical protein
MADDLKYGYKGAEPTQSFGNNTGVFDPNDINNLIADNKWKPNNSDLVLLSTMDFENVSSLTVGLPTGYDTHFLLFNEFSPIADNTQLQARFVINGSINTSSQYSYHVLRNDDSNNSYSLVATTSSMVLFNATSSQIKYSGGWNMMIHGAANDTVIPKCSWTGVSVDANGDTLSFDGDGMFSDGGSGTTPTRTRQEAIHFFQNSNNISGHVKVFGVYKP